MTDQPSPRPAAAAARRRPLYRTVLAIATAALLAAWLPFTVMYATAVNKQATVAVTTWKAGHPVLTTKTSGGRVIQTSTPVASTKSAPPAAVVTRAS
jgi:hypothetical protein